MAEQKLGIFGKVTGETDPNIKVLSFTPLSGYNKINPLEQDLGMQMAETAREN